MVVLAVLARGVAAVMLVPPRIAPELADPQSTVLRSSTERASPWRSSSGDSLRSSAST